MNKNATVLIQLIGQQTIPNIHPVLIIKPDSVYNLCTDTTLAQGKKVNNWITNKYAGSIRVHLKKLQEDDLYASTLTMCQQLLEQHADKNICLNLTGGNKLMSLAAYQAAQNKPNVTIIYVNSDKKTDTIYVLQTSEEDKNRSWKTDKGEGLTILDILEVGEHAVEYSSLRDWHLCVPAAKAVQELADNITPEGLTKQVRGDSKNRRLLSKLRKAALRDPQLAASFEHAGCKFTLNSAGEEINTSFLTGMWWEILVADYLERSGKYTEVKCSVQTWISPECGLTDVDVLATDGLTLTCFSCKRNLSQPDSEINKHENRSKQLGGIKATCGIAVYRGNEDSYTKLRQLTKPRNMQCLTGPDVCPGLQIEATRPKPTPRVDVLDLLSKAQQTDRPLSVEDFLG